MEYLLFTYPNCSKCAEIRGLLAGTDIEGREYDLTQKESKLRIREFLGLLKRDEKGGILLPTLVLREEGNVLAVVNDPQELEAWLRSRA